MIDLPAIRELYRYNAWANHRVFENLGTLTHDGLTRDLGSSYPSLRDTVLHLVWSEWIWLQRWKGTSPRVVFGGEDFPVLDAIRAKWSEVDTERRAFLDGLPSERLPEILSYINLQGQMRAYPLWRQMMHVVNHSTYHRGQITTMMRQLKAPAVATDFLVFCDVDAERV